MYIPIVTLYNFNLVLQVDVGTSIKEQFCGLLISFTDGKEQSRPASILQVSDMTYIATYTGYAYQVIEHCYIGAYKTTLDICKLVHGSVYN